jgi:hypothetical protein
VGGCKILPTHIKTCQKLFSVRYGTPCSKMKLYLSKNFVFFFYGGFFPFQRDLPFCVNHLVHLNFVIKIFTFGKAPWIRALPNVALGSIATSQPHLPVM